MFNQLEKINTRPRPFEFYTAADLWTDEYISKQMLRFHLDPHVDIASRKAAFIDRSVAWIISEFDLGPGKAVADFGCGPGLYTQRLARCGAAVTGIDFSENSLEYARRQAQDEKLAIEYVRQNYLEFDTQRRFDLITLIMCDYTPLSPEQRRLLRARFKALLKPGGAVLLDAYSMKALEEKEEKTAFWIEPENNFWSPEKCYSFLNVFKYEEEKLSLDKHTIVEKDGVRTIYDWFQHFTLEGITAEFAESGLKIEKFLANVAGDEFDPDGGEFAIVARSR